MQIRHVIAVTALVVATTCAHAQAQYYSSDKLHAMAHELAIKAEKSESGSSSVVLEKYPATPAPGQTSPGQSINVIGRAKSGGGEIHQRFTDVFLVLDGEATLLTGGSIPNVKIDAATGEGRGAKVVGGVEQVLHRGDIFHIPAGVPHQTLVPAGKKFEYICVKVGAEKANPVATSSSTVDYWSAAKLQSLSDDGLASAKASANGTANVTLVRYNEHFMNVTARVKTAASSELHGHYSDLFLMLSGEMTEVTSGSVPDMKIDPATGEGHSSSIQGGTKNVLHAGDVLHIDPNTPHQTLMDAGKSFTAIVIKLHQE